MHRDYPVGMHTRILLPPGISVPAAGNSGHLGDEMLPGASTSPDQIHDRVRVGPYVSIALVALLTGYVLGLLGGSPSGSSRAGWPPPPTNPRSLNP